MSDRVVLVSPCRNEAKTLARTIACVEAQTHPPAQWVIVDDGSSDETASIVAEAAARLPYIKLVSLPDRGYRKVGGGVVEAFDAGRAAVDVPHEFIAKLDVDLEFEPEYLERALELFARDDKLAAVSGKVFRPERDRLVEEFMIDEMVAGQFKLYRRDALDAIGGFVREVMWDGIDMHQCRRLGLRTASVQDAALRIVHLRMMGASDRNVFRGRLRWGGGQWFMGSSFPYVLASGVFRFREKPYVIGGLLIILGYLWAALRDRPRYEEPGFRESLRSWQRERLVQLVRGGGFR
ncbi:MAG: glycosyltransferase family 2 protein [Myxococcota bacterium]